ncbi:MAG: HlyD family efflux transporter periplasmic adaptor subunit [Candidatus Obscuribacter sp.]|nr:HlyD family efflux transporter periplasmic adaptor subunit [Candidatus Obscuribacter sp.]MBL0189681.1 HlyD family efflux transporter periplasmic adaptor subunit [Candidatus Obscuribacter sp.]MBP7578285.1 HlyD family efflux transporter periplasmic adaptor subunit [Candidatus Obscuribacter sp.]
MSSDFDLAKRSLGTKNETLAGPDGTILHAGYRSMESVKSPAGYFRVAIVLAFFIVVIACVLAFVPWQQSVSGIGKVIIVSPMERPQNIEAPIPARLARLHVRDGQTVQKGQLIAELVDLDPKFLDTMQSKRLDAQRKALDARRAAAEARYKALQRQIDSLKKSQGIALPSARERTHQAHDRIMAAEQAIEAAKQNKRTTEVNLARLQELHDKGVRSKRDLELAELEHARALTDLERAFAALDIANRDETLANYDQAKVLADTNATMSSIEAAISSAHETIETTRAEICKLDVDMQNVKHRSEQRRVLAPCEGKIVRLMCVGAGETVDAGTVLAVIAPDTQDIAAELTVSDNDAPLVSVGRPVRLQFAGWPALQFAGWPSIAVGTFGGRVAVIDAVDDGRSSYRVIVKPDLEAIAAGRDEAWPGTQHLRPGAEASGWIMLETVPLGFELWRQFNAFPPTVQPEGLGLTKSPDIGKSESKRKSK